MFRSIINKISFPTGLPQHNYLKFYPQYVQKHQLSNKNKQKFIYSAFVPFTTKTKKLIIYAHGNAETIFYTVPLMEDYSKKFECNFVTFDYEGCGLSDGTPSENALIRASELIYNIYKDDYDILVWGRSIGSISAAYLGEKYNIKTIIQSGLASAFHVAFNNVKTNFGNEFMNFKRVPAIKQLVIIHGTRDNIVPFQNGQENFKAWIYGNDGFQVQKYNGICAGMDLMQYGGCNFYIIHGAGHNDIDLTFNLQLTVAVKDFIK